MIFPFRFNIQNQHSSSIHRPLKEGKATGVIIACARWIDPASPDLDREKLYWEFSSQTCWLTRLGPYILDEESLYVNGYNHLACTKIRKYSVLQFPHTFGVSIGKETANSLYPSSPTLS
ncbi:mucin-16-like [Vombatus ursinus]|uniref:mucin-16-like n=1 Tax=Vombatus ursinus TaxID=29139 RepID=UPI000FFD16B3|nr:mucin-16-like [Vombatus ursinus]